MECDDIYSIIQTDLPQDWVTGRTVDRKTFELRNKPISVKIQNGTGTDIVAQFWKNKDSNLKFEFASNEIYKDFRELLASSFRDFIFSKNHPTWLNQSKGSTVLHVTLKNITDSESKVLINMYFKFIREELDDWASEILPTFLTPQAREFITAGKIKELESEAAKKRAVRRMVKTAKDTVAGANGQQVSQKVKEKENRFATDEEFDKYVTDLLKTQNGLCAITSLTLQFDDQADDQELLVSLDRIDSDGHYEPGNLQVVCRFVNRWKSDGNDAEFRRLISLVRNSKL